MKQWYALRSKPKRESAAAALLDRAGLEVFVPEIKVKKRAGNAVVVEPFFPGYLFSRLDASAGEIHMANYTHGILYVVGYAQEPWPVPDGLIATLKERLAHQPGRALLADVNHGDRLLITNGPFKGFEAVFDRYLSPTGRVQVLIEILNRVCRAEIDAGQLRNVGRAA
jgi:transcriptional antiterminator RfaH